MLDINPERDENGNVVAHDNDKIENESLVIRRVSHHHIKTHSNGKPIIDENGDPLLSTMVMQPSSRGNKGMSVDLEALIISDGLNPREFVTTPEFMGSISLTAGDFRDEMLQVGYDPIPKNNYHGAVWGEFPKGRKKRLLRKFRWYVKIPANHHRL